MIENTVSVVIPTRDRWPLLQRAITSVFAQTHRVDEIIVVDDGSVDETAENMRSFRLPIPVQMLALGESHGAPHARNAGIDASRSRFVALLDSDDEWMPSYLETALSYFETDPPPVAVCSAVLRHSKGSKRVVRPRWRGSGFEELLGFHTAVSSASGIVVGREAIGGARFDESLAAMQEHDFLISLSRLGRVACNPACLAVAHDDAPVRVTSLDNHLQARLRLLNKYADDLGSRPAALANHRYRLARLHWQRKKGKGVQYWLKEAAKADPSNKRLRTLALAASLGPRIAERVFAAFIRTARIKRSLDVRLGRVTE